MNIKDAVIKENLEEVKIILSHYPKEVEVLDAEGIPISFLAAKTGNIQLVKYIVEYSMASMNTIDKNGRNILHFGTMSGNLTLVKYLVEKVGMSPVSGDRNLMTPMDVAKEYGHKEVLAYFEKICGTAYDDMYRNPIRTGMFPDPSIVRVGEDYYMVNSSFIYFPCIPISHSKDLVNWKIIGHAITNPIWSELDGLEGGRGYWAPDISYYEGRFYITATYRMNDTGTIYRKQMIVSSDKPEGPYTKPVFIEDDGIDPSIFNDEDGRRYMLLNRGARILELNKEATKQISEARLLYYGDQKRAPEGPHLLKKDGYYYLFLAEGGTGLGHRITVARSKTLMGNYEPCPYNPIMRQFDKKATLQRCGHGKPVKTQNDEWFMVYLCGRMIGKGFSILGRETALDPMTWTKDGWPIINGLNGPSSLQKKPDLPEMKTSETGYDDFTGCKLGLDWMFPRPPERDGYRIDGDKLWIRGSRVSTCNKEAKNIVLKRQQHFAFIANTKLGPVKLMQGQDTGLICYYDENTWVKFGVFGLEGEKCSLKVIEHIGHMNRVNKHTLEIPRNVVTIYLQVETDYLNREFFYSFDGQNYLSLAKLYDVNYLSDEGIVMGKRFTGAMIGMYAYDQDGKLEVPFDFFNYKKRN